MLDIQDTPNEAAERAKLRANHERTIPGLAMWFDHPRFDTEQSSDAHFARQARNERNAR